MLAHPHKSPSPAPLSEHKCRVIQRWRALFSPFFAIVRTVLVGTVVFLPGCGAASFELHRPDGVIVRASGVALFRDTGLEGFNYSVDEQSRGAGLLPAVESRKARVGAKGYTGTTKAETIVKLLEVLD